jgi:RNA 3'-terminal phosphate cyclase-like protein
MLTYLFNRILFPRAIKITNIRLNDEMPGLRDYEASLLKLVDKLTNGSKIVINETGTAVTVSPGQLTGGKISHDCSTGRSVVYYLEVVAALAPFCKEPVVLQLKGSTHDDNDDSVDIFRSVTMPLLQKLGVSKTEDSSLSFRVVSRGYGAEATGSIIFTCPTLRHIEPVELLNEGLVSRIRGVFWSSQMNREFAPRFVDCARGILNQCVEDVWIYTEIVKNSSEPVYGVSLMAETNYGFFKGVSAIEKDPSNIEKVAKNLSKKIMHAIDKNGVCDASHQWLVCLFMALAQDHKVSSCILGNELSPATIEFMRYIQKFLLVKFNMARVERDNEDSPIKIECIGINMGNTARKSL